MSPVSETQDGHLAQGTEHPHVQFAGVAEPRTPSKPQVVAGVAADWRPSTAGQFPRKTSTKVLLVPWLKPSSACRVWSMNILYM